jgi:glycerophosphoryl diester phosphodiesterase
MATQADVDAEATARGGAIAAEAAARAAADAAEVVRANGTYAPRTGSAEYLATPARVATDLAAGAYSAHRTDYALYPENTLEAFKLALATGATSIEFDLERLIDGSFAVMHDSTTTRTTNTSGTNVASYNAGAWKQLVIPAGTNFAAAWGNLNPPLLAEVLDEVGGRMTLFYNLKSGLVSDVNALIAVIVKRGLQASSVMLIDALENTAWIGLCQAAGIATAPTWNGSAGSFLPSVATILATNPTMLGVGYQYTDSDITSLVTAAHAAGKTVYGFSMNRRFERDRMASLGVDFHMVNDHLYPARSTALHTTDSFFLGTPVSGMISWRSPASGTIIIPAFTGTPKRLLLPNTVTNEFIMMGDMCPVANPASWTLTGTVTWDNLDTDATRHFDILVCAPDDAPHGADSKQSGYVITFLQNGTLRIFKATAGATANGVKAAGTTAQVTGNIASTAVSAGQAVPWTVVVTGTTITFTRTDTSVSVSTTDSTFRGGYFHVGKLGSTTGVNGLAVSVSGLSVT